VRFLQHQRRPNGSRKGGKDASSHSCRFFFAVALTVACGDDSEPSGAGGNGSSGAGANTGVGTGPLCAVTSDIAISAGQATVPAIVRNGGGFAVAYGDLSNDEGDIVFALVDGGGNKTAETIITNSREVSSLPSIAALRDGSFLVMWQDAQLVGSLVRARRVDAEGNVVGGQFDVAMASADQSRPAGVDTSSGVAIAWSDNDSSYVGLVNGAAMARRTPFDASESVSVALSGSALGITWSSPGEVAFAAVSAPYDDISATSTMNVDGHLPRVAAGKGGDFFVTWEDWRGGEGSENIFVTRASSGEMIGEAAVPSEAGSANYPDIVFSGTHVGVVYYQFRDAPPAVYLTQFDQGLKRVGRDLQVSRGSPEGAKYPKIAWNGRDYGVAYAEMEGPVRLALVSCD
jgi:hypothetical protein